jgi:O-antigen/teichoic acid export membrane protein
VRIFQALRRHRRIGGAAAANVIIAVIGAISGVLAARVLGVVGRGELAAIQIPGLVTSTLAMLGLPEAMVHFSRRHPADANTIIPTAVTATAVSALCAAAIVAPTIPALLRGSSDSVVRLAQWWMVLPLATAFSGMPIMSVRALGREATWNVLRMAPGGLWVAVLILASTLPTEDRLSAVVFGQLGVLFGLGILVWVYLLLTKLTPLRLSMPQAVRMLRYGLPLALTSVPQTFNFRLDQLILLRFVAKEELGYYVAGVAWSSAVTPIVSAFGVVVFVRLAGTADSEEARRIILTSVRPALATAFASCVAAIVLAPLILPIVFGAEFRPAVRVAQILSLGGAPLAASGVLGNVLQGVHRTGKVLSTELAGLAVNLTGLAALIHTFGILGAALASLLAYSTIFFFRLRIVLVHTGTSVADLLRLR